MFASIVLTIYKFSSAVFDNNFYNLRISSSILSFSSSKFSSTAI